MTKIPPTYPEKFMPTNKGIFTLTFSLIMFGALSFILVFSTKVNGDLFDLIVIYCIALFFLLFFFASLYYILTIKIVYINQFKGLTIRYPLIFRKLEINLNDLEKTREQPFLIKHKGDFTTKADIIYSGKRLTISLDNNRNIELNSFMTKDFYTLKDFIIRQKLTMRR